jgi:uncharacterized protein DUF4388
MAMTKSKDITAESIGDLLEVAHLQHRQGMLHVEYSQSGYIEAGEIYLQAGEPIYARVGSLTGDEALHYLLGWRNIYFAFSSEIPSPPANIISGMRSDRVNVSTNTFANIAPPTFSPPPQGPRWSLVEEHTAHRSTLSLSDMTWLVPQKVGYAQDALALPLTRRQRSIYFLIDGQRTVSDLMRTTSKAVSDVEVILGELQEQGLIVI